MMAKRRTQSGNKAAAGAPNLDRSPPWAVVYYEAPDGSAPALEFLD
jgi:hypothetical protein